MSSLAFDKTGKPFSFQRRAKKLLVRLFRNPSARGTCTQVMTADGHPLFVDPETDYVEFRKSVGHVPGLYRLDQCDENGIELDDAQAAYVAIDIARNASPSATDTSTGEVNPLVIIEHLVAIQADAMKTMAAQHAAVMAATAEILRAPYRPAPPPTAVPELRNASDDDTDDDESEPQPIVVESPWLKVMEQAGPMLQMLGGLTVVWLQQRIFPGSAVAMPGMPAMPAMPTMMHGGGVPMTAHAPAPAAPMHSAPMPVHHTPAPSSPIAVPPPTVVPVAPIAPTVDPAVGADAENESADETMTAPPLATPPAASTSMSVAEQYAHLLAIRARLAPDEGAYAEAVIASMSPAQRAQWMAALSAMSLDEATASIRTTIAQLRTRKA